MADPTAAEARERMLATNPASSDYARRLDQYLAALEREQPPAPEVTVEAPESILARLDSERARRATRSELSAELAKATPGSAAADKIISDIIALESAQMQGPSA